MGSFSIPLINRFWRGLKAALEIFRGILTGLMQENEHALPDKLQA